MGVLTAETMYTEGRGAGAIPGHAIFVGGEEEMQTLIWASGEGGLFTKFEN